MNEAVSILKTYLRRLTSLGGNNRSLVLLRLHQEQLIDLSKLSQFYHEPAFAIVQALIAGKEMPVCPVNDPRMEVANAASQKLKRIQRVDKFLYEERGSYDLHVAWPFVHGKFSDGTLVRAPLLFFPVAVKQVQNDWVLTPRKDAGVTFNKTFLLAYFFYNQVKPDESLLETDFEEFDSDSTVFRTQLYQLLKNRLEINFNPDTFTNQLIAFTEYRKNVYDEQHRTGELKLYNEAVLGIFPQAGSQLVPDYLSLIESNQYDSLEQLFAERSRGESSDLLNNPAQLNLAMKEEKVYAPFQLDAWQEHALKAQKLGHSLVVQGPPGTGKSQLICNLIADQLASGKRVLLVCQKRVALDVVHQRLAGMDLGEFLGVIHDFRDDRKIIYQQIARQINKLEEYQALNRGIDAIQTERKFNQVSRTIDHLTEELEEFRQALFDEKECGRSVKELYLTSDPTAESINIKQEYQFFTQEQEEDFVKKLSRYVRYAAKFEVDDYPWKSRHSMAGFTHAKRKQLEDILQEIPVFQTELGNQLEKLAGLYLNLEDAESLLQRRPDVDEMVKLLADETAYRFFLSMIDEKDAETSLLWVQNMERLVLNCFDESGIEKSLRNEQIGQCQLALQQRMVARRNWIRLIRWELFSEHKFFLKRVLISNDLPYNKTGLRTLEARLDNRLNFEHHLTALREKKWLIEFPVEPQAKAIKKWFEKQRFAIRAKLLFTSLREIKQGINPLGLTRDEFIRLIWSIFDALEPLTNRKEAWQQVLTSFQIKKVARQQNQKELLVKALRDDFDLLVEYDTLKDGFEEHHREVIKKLHDKINEWRVDAFVELFKNSIRLAWIDHIETKYPVLQMASTLRMEEVQEELRQLIEQKRLLCKEIILLRAREVICDRLEFNRLKNRTTYRELLHQVTKKKKIWPVRKLIHEFQDELFRLIPCWMASPESVSAVFPMQAMFDLVIFDEASQCFAERGLPALCRGKQVLIAGDSKQLQPFDLYQVRWEEDTESIEAEVDSLLDLSNVYFPTVYLNGHYRSRAVELIRFSNEHFYSGKLVALPDKQMIDQQEPAIEYVKLDGIWENQTNVGEADKVVELVMHYIRNDPELELGIVTFNLPQQMLIMDKIEEACASNSVPVPVTLFIKNIENVQGDEKDVIIFSIGYAPDKDGKFNMQFGSLNVAGGENRLNVAVTRARQKIIIVSSIWPEELRLQGIKNEGPKLLRAYLEYARSVSNKEPTQEPGTNGEYHRAWYFNAHIKKWGEQIQKFELQNRSLPFADLVVTKEQVPQGVILTDDDLYVSAYTAKDAHAYVPERLTEKRWSFIRLFSRNWWTKRDTVEHELKKYLYQLEHRDAPPD